MSEFNYQKAYCVQAVPAFEALPEHVKAVHAALLPLVGELRQGRSLAIPVGFNIQELLRPLTSKEIAELARASYFVGHGETGGGGHIPRVCQHTKK
jgi:hypothetical protein